MRSSLVDAETASALPSPAGIRQRNRIDFAVEALQHPDPPDREGPPDAGGVA